MGKDLSVNQADCSGCDQTFVVTEVNWPADNKLGSDIDCSDHNR